MSNVKWIGAALVAGLVAGGGTYWYVGRDTAPVGIQRQVIRDMVFPMGLDMTVGDDAGNVCVQVIKRSSRGSPDIFLGERTVRTRDFRGAPESDKQAWVKEAAEAVVEASGLMACGPSPDDWFLGAAASPAYAPPTCEDCGGGCGSYGCPADLVIPYPQCFIPGPDCVVTVICCGSGCTPGC